MGHIRGARVIPEGHGVILPGDQSAEHLLDRAGLLNEGGVVLIWDRSVVGERTGGVVHADSADDRPARECRDDTRRLGGIGRFEAWVADDHLTWVALDDVHRIDEGGGIAPWLPSGVLESRCQRLQ